MDHLQCPALLTANINIFTPTLERTEIISNLASIEMNKYECTIDQEVADAAA